MRVNAGIIRIANPVTGALFDKITGTRRDIAAVELGITNLAGRAFAIAVARSTIVIGIADSFDALLPDVAIVITGAFWYTFSRDGGIVRGSRGK